MDLLSDFIDFFGFLFKLVILIGMTVGTVCLFIYGFSYFTAGPEVAVFNRMYGTHYTAREWIFASDMIRKEFNSDRTRIDAKIRVDSKTE